MAEIMSLLRSLWTVWLALIFVGIVAWAYWPRHRKRFEEHGRIPLEDDSEENRE